MQKLIPFLILWFYSVSLFGQETIELKDPGNSYYFIEEYTVIYKDPSNSLPPQEVYTKKFNLNVIDYNENPDWKTSAFWFKIKIKNSSDYETWLLECRRRFTSKGRIQGIV
jgi:hypothetical protein